MPAHRTPRWTAAELAVLCEQYPVHGIDIAAQLPGRSWQSIYVMASKLGLKSGRHGTARKSKLQGDDLEEAIRLREEDHWSFARIGARLGVAEASACNAVLIALCTRKGFTPAERNPHGRLTEAGRERIRLALKKGWKGVDIQLKLGVSAACVAEQRRRYNRELKERGKVLLPPPGGGQSYSGVKLTRAKRAEVEALFLEGLGTLKVSERAGVSKTSCTRIRNRLVRRLRKRGDTLPGCDLKGVRHVQVESSRFIADEQKQALRTMLLDRVPVRRAAELLAIGLCSAYRIRDVLAAELAERGEVLPKPILPGRVRRAVDPDWPPHSAKDIYAFRELLHTMPSFDDAKVHWRRTRKAERVVEAQRPKTFEEQLELVAAGKLRLAPAMPRKHLEPQRSAA